MRELTDAEIEMIAGGEDCESGETAEEGGNCYICKDGKWESIDCE